MQNARLSELEKLVAKSSATPIGRGKKMEFASSEDYNALKEENRVVSTAEYFDESDPGRTILSAFFLPFQLMEAMDVLQREVEVYENEIRALKDFKSPTKRGVAGRTPKRTPIELSPAPRGVTVEDAHTRLSLEATLFRPALQQALQESARWKTEATAKAFMELPPLPELPQLSSAEEKSTSTDDFIRLSAAVSACRIEKASITLVDLTSTVKSPREQLRDIKARSAAASERLETTLLRCIARSH